MAIVYVNTSMRSFVFKIVVCGVLPGKRSVERTLYDICSRRRENVGSTKECLTKSGGD